MRTGGTRRSGRESEGSEWVTRPARGRGGFRRGEGALREPVAAKRIQRGWGFGSRKVFIVVVGSLTPPTLIKQQKQTKPTVPRGAGECARSSVHTPRWTPTLLIRCQAFEMPIDIDVKLQFPLIHSKKG